MLWGSICALHADCSLDIPTHVMPKMDIWHWINLKSTTSVNEGFQNDVRERKRLYSLIIGLVYLIYSAETGYATVIQRETGKTPAMTPIYLHMTTTCI